MSEYSENMFRKYSLIMCLIQAFGHLGIWAFRGHLRDGFIVLFPANTYPHSKIQNAVKTERNILLKKNYSSFVILTLHSIGNTN